MVLWERHIKALLGLLAFNLLFITVVLLVSQTTVFAGSQEIDREVARLIKEVPLTKSYQDAGAVVLLKEGRMKVEKDGVFTLTIHLVAKALDEKAASHYSQISIQYNSYYEETTLILARTIKEDGTIRTVSSDAVQIKTSPRGKEYSDIRFLTFSLPALEKGSTFEYEVKRQRKIPLIENKWSQSVSFQSYHYNDYSLRIDPVYKSKFVLEVPEDEPFLYETENVKITPTISKKPSMLVYTWEVNNLPAVPIEHSMPPLEEFVPYICVSSIKTWEEVGESMSKFFLPSIEACPEINTKAHEITKGAKSREEKIEAIFYFIEGNIKYVAADLNRGGFKPHPASEVLKNKYGDCKDQAVLFISLLKSVGIAAHPALITANFNYEINKKVPSPDFDHVIVCIPREENPFWLDTTPGVARFPNLSWPCQNKWALVMNGQKSKLLKTVGSKPEDNEGKMNMDVVFKDSIVNYYTTIGVEGALSDSFKGLMKILPFDQQKEFINEFFRGSSTMLQIRDVKIADTTNPQLPFEILVHMQFADDQLQKAPRYSTAFSLKPLLNFFTGLSTLPQPEDRKNAYRFYFPFRLVYNGFCPPPRKGMKPISLPKTQSIETPFFTFNVEYVRDGDSVHLKQVFVSKQTRIDREQYKPFYESVQEVLRKSDSVINFTYNRGDIQADELEEVVKKEPDNAKALLELAKSHLRKGRYKEAKALLDKSVLIEPNNGEIHYFLGIALGYLDFFEDSKRELKKAKELGY